MEKSARFRAVILGLCFPAATYLACTQTESVKQAGDSAARSENSNLGAVSEADARYVGGIIGSPHDFTRGGGAALDLCTPCHTPHLSIARPAAFDDRPPQIQALRPYVAYDVQLDGSSLLCLSCHDGIVAKDVYASAHAATFSSQLGSSWVGVGSLTSHPIGVEYPLVDPRYRSIAAVAADGRILLPDGRVQCISCHDPHNTRRIRGLLVRSNEGSRLCLSCHRL